MDYSYYLTSVRLWVNRLSDGVVDLDDLPDVVDIGECFEDGISAEECATMILEENGADWL